MPDIFSKWKQSLERTRKSTFGRIATMVGASEINQHTWDDLEELLIQSDLGVLTTNLVIDSLKKRVFEIGIFKSGEFKGLLRSELLSRLITPGNVDFQNQQPAVILLVGVNGSGKTTTAAKLGKIFADNG